MGSSRLPSKVMMPIDDKPLIGYQIERLLTTGLPIIVATSENPNNDKLVEYVESLGVKVFRGSEDNVLERYYKAAKHFHATDIIRITGDNPLMDPDFIKEQLQEFSPDSRRCYLYEGGLKKLPLGMSFELFSFELLEEAYKNAKVDSEKEHVTPYMHQNMPGNIEIHEFNTEINFPKARLTVDASEDYELIKKLILEYNCHHKNTQEIIDVLIAHKNLMEINNSVVQKKWME